MNEKKFAAGLVGGCSSLAFSIAVASFVTWGFDPASWEQGNRGLFAYLATIATIAGGAGATWMVDD